MASDTRRDADLAFVNGRVITVNRQDDVAEAAAIVGNRIVRVGSDESIKALVGNGTRVVDLAGRALTPGFVENHMHITNAAEDRKWINCSPEVASSIDEIAAAVKKRVDETPAGELVVGWGFDHHRLRERRYPTRRDLDPVSPNHPVLLRQRESMSWTANTAGVAPHGHPGRHPGPSRRADAAGRTGSAPGAHVGQLPGGVHLPGDSTADPGRTGGRLRVGMRVPEPARGHQCGRGSHPQRGGVPRLAASARPRGSHRPRLPQHLSGLRHPVGRGDRGLPIFRSGMRTGFGDDWLRLGPAVIGIDGGVQGQTAALFEPYSNDPEGTFRGSFRVSREMADEFCLEAHKAGFQIAAIPHGDHGITVTLDAIEKAMRAYPRPDPRHRLEHAYLWNAELLDRAARLNVIYNAQPPILEVLGEACTLEPWGEQRSRYAFPVKSLLDRGVLSSGGSDMPIVTANPMVGIDCLVNRRLDPSPGGTVLNPDERLTVMEALRVYTYNGAYAHFEETAKGSVEEGKLADLAVLSRDILTAPVEEIRHITVDMTVVDGKVVHE